MTIPQAAINLILESEGVDQPSRWPEGQSGITIGYGCDIGADPGSLEFWRGVLTDSEIKLLATAKGKVGPAAEVIASRFSGIKISRAQALKVFMEKSLPIEIIKTLRAFPGLEFMPAEVRGSMVSLVYNRGTDLRGDRRSEMRIIYEICQEFGTFDATKRESVRVEYTRKIAKQFRSMKRLWVGKGLDGLLTRRDAEADLILSSIA